MANAPRRLYERYRSSCVDAPASGGDVAFSFLSGDKVKDYTWSQLFAEAEALGERLHCDLANKGNLLAILSASQERQVIGVLAALGLGMAPAILTPPNRKLQPAFFAKYLRGVLEQTRPRFVITDLDAEHLADLPTSQRSFDLMNWEGQKLGESDSLTLPIELPVDTVFVQFSSGTTGVKKGVAIDCGALQAQLQIYGDALQLEPTATFDGAAVIEGDCIVSWLPLYHDMGYITALHLPISRRIRTIMIDPLHWVAHPNSYLEAATQYGATLGWHPNFAYSFMADRFIPGENPIDLSRIRHLVNCSEPVTAVAQSKFRERFSEFGLRPGVMTGCYAMAETTFAVTHGSKVDEIGIDASGPSNPGTLVDRLPMVSTGRALPGIEIEIRINAINVDDGVIGEIYIRAPFLAHGYLGNAEATERSFENGWYATGDLGYKKGGQVYVIGREKDTIIAAGHNVFPEDIEQEISEDISVRSGRVVVFGEFEQRNQTERVVALAEPADAGVSIDVVALRQQLLTGFGVGVSLYQVEPGWIVKSSSGKPSRSATREKWRSENSS